MLFLCLRPTAPKIGQADMNGGEMMLCAATFAAAQQRVVPLESRVP